MQTVITDPRIIDQHRDTVILINLFNMRTQCLRVRNVTDHRMKFFRLFFAKLLCFCSFKISSKTKNFIPIFDKHTAECQSDSGRRSRYNRRICHICHIRVLLYSSHKNILSFGSLFSSCPVRNPSMRVSSSGGY